MDFCSHVNLFSIDDGLGSGIGFLRGELLRGETFCQVRPVWHARQEAGDDSGGPAAF
jgi:hypothetical protein